MNDINWMLSTVVQSSAAIVGILGGFLVSRTLSISAERNGFESKHRDLMKELQIKMEDKDNISNPNHHRTDMRPRQVRNQEIEDEIKRINERKKEIEERLDNMGKPKGLYLGLIVLFLFSASGIIYPLAFIPAGYDEKIHTNVYWSFTIGLGIVLSYIYWSIVSLTSYKYKEK